MRPRILGTTRDLRTDTHVLYCQVSVDDYLRLVGDSFHKFEVQRKRESHNAYQRMRNDIKMGALLPVFTLASDPRHSKTLISYLEKEDLESLEVALSRPGSLNILDGLQRTYALFQLKREGVVFPPDQKLLLEVWLEQNPHNYIYRIFVLNAGQKPMSARHQFKLIFLTIENLLVSQIHHLEIYRKQHGVSQLDRPGKYTFDSVVTSFLCFLMGRFSISIDNLVAREKAMEDIFNSDPSSLSDRFLWFKKILEAYTEIDLTLHQKTSAERVFHREWFMNAFFAACSQHLKDTPGRENELFVSLQLMSRPTENGESADGFLPLKHIRDRINSIDPKQHNLDHQRRKLVFDEIRRLFGEETE